MLVVHGNCERSEVSSMSRYHQAGFCKEVSDVAVTAYMIL